MFVEELTIQGIKEVKAKASENNLAERLQKYHGPYAYSVLSTWWDMWLSPGFKDWSLKPWLAKITCPSLIIHGIDDQYGSTAQAKFMNENILAPTTLEILENTGHFPHKERSKTVIDLTATFLRAID